jgi:hypothetical protein
MARVGSRGAGTLLAFVYFGLAVWAIVLYTYVRETPASITCDVPVISNLLLSFGIAVFGLFALLCIIKLISCIHGLRAKKISTATNTAYATVDVLCYLTISGVVIGLMVAISIFAWRSTCVSCFRYYSSQESGH